MKVTHIIGAAIFCGLASTSFACDLPPLVAIPAKDKVGDQAQQIRDATKAYFDAMTVYTTCVQAELTAAGGDKAPPITKAVLVQRNNAAVTEAEGVLKLMNTNLGPTVAPASQFNQGGQAPAPIPPATSERTRGR